MRGSSERYDVYDEIFENEEFGIQKLGGNFPTDTDIVKTRSEEDAPDEIMEAWSRERGEGWRVYDYNPRLRDRFLNRYRIGEPEGYILQFRTEVKLDGWTGGGNETCYFHLGLMPRENYNELYDVLKQYGFQIEQTPEDSGVTVLD